MSYRHGPRLVRWPAIRLAILAMVIGFLLGFAAPKLFANENPMKLAAERTHVVVSGDTLWRLAATFGKGQDPRSYVWRLQNLNKLGVPSLFPGEKLLLP